MTFPCECMTLTSMPIHRCPDCLSFKRIEFTVLLDGWDKSGSGITKIFYGPSIERLMPNTRGSYLTASTLIFTVNFFISCLFAKLLVAYVSLSVGLFVCALLAERFDRGP